MSETPKNKIDVLTFGCRLNTYESQVMAREAKAAGLDTLDGGAVVVNTCAVTAKAVRDAKSAIRRARRENPDARIIVSGCAAQTEPETFADMDEVDLVLGNEEKLSAHSYRQLPDFGVNLFEKVRVNDIMDVRESASHMVEAIEARTRAFVQVQNGCDHRCTFCIIPYGRGNSRSVPAGEVVRQVQLLVDKGYGEVVLTGVDLTSWGGDLPGTPSLGRLVQAILSKVTGLKRLRLSSIDSIEVDEALMDAIGGDRRLMPHLHLSLQSGDDMILKRMKRRHLRDHTIQFCHDVRAVRPDMVFGADIIAGFPTETDAMFENSLSIVDEAGMTHLHVFPYSSRPGTPAAKMPPVAGPIIKERAARLRAKGAEALSRHLQDCVGRDVSVLLEGEPSKTNGVATMRGRLEQFTAVQVALPPGERRASVAPGDIVSVRIDGHTGAELTGHLEKMPVHPAPNMVPQGLSRDGAEQNLREDVT